MSFPVPSEALVTALEARYPEPVYKPGMTLVELELIAAKREVVNHLRIIYEKNKEPTNGRSLLRSSGRGSSS